MENAFFIRSRQLGFELRMWLYRAICPHAIPLNACCRRPVHLDIVNLDLNSVLGFRYPKRSTALQHDRAGEFSSVYM